MRFSKKTAHRIIISLAMVFPIAYMLGTQIAALAGAHGEELLAQEETMLSNPTETVYNGDQTDLVFDGGYFGISSLRGSYSLVNGEIIGAQSSYVSLNGFNVELPNVVLYGYGGVYDSVTYDGIFTKKFNLIPLSSLTDWRMDGVNGYWYARSIPNARQYFQYAFVNNMTKGNQSAVEGIWFTSGAGYFEIYAPSCHSASDVQAYLEGSYLLYCLQIYEVSNVDGWQLPLKATSPLDVVFNSDIPQTFVFTTFENVFVESDYSGALFGNMFPRGNFVEKIGSNAVGEDPKGFAPFASMLRYLDLNMLHAGDTQIGLMFYGMIYWMLHVILADLVYHMLVFIPNLIMSVAQWLGHGLDDDKGES